MYRAEVTYETRNSIASLSPKAKEETHANPLSQQKLLLFISAKAQSLAERRY